MKMIFRLALRNIFRNKRRTIITFLSIISGMIGIIIFGGFVQYTFWGLREMTIKTQLGHIQIYKQGYSEKGIAQPNKYLIKNSAEVKKALKKMPGLKTISARLTCSGLISTGEKTLMCKVVGVEPEKEIYFNDFETIIDGVQLEPGEDGGVISDELRKALGAKVGDYMTIMTTSIDGMFNAIDFKIIGVAQTGSQDYDSVFVKLPIDKVKSLLGTSAEEKLVILLQDTKDLPQAITYLNEIIKKENLNIEYKQWDELAVFYHKVVKVYDGIFKVINVIIGVIILFSIINTMCMSIFERVREIGTLRALGTTKHGIIKLFVMEGILIGIIGSILGMMAGVIIAFIINFSGGIYIPPPPGMSRGYQAFILTPMSLLGFAFIFITIVSVVSSIYPAFKASKLKIVDALGHI